MKYQTMSIAQTRMNLADIIEKVSIGRETFAVTKFGKLKALITPIDDTLIQSEAMKKKQFVNFLEESSGIFKDRKDMKSSKAWVTNQRKPRYEKVFD